LTTSLQDGNEWIVIDPKGIVGDVEFEMAAFDFIYHSELDNKEVTDFYEKSIALISQKSNLNFQRIKDWVFVRLILSAAWSIEDNRDYSWAIQLARLL
jgi:streptomycin 6-kinase